MRLRLFALTLLACAPLAFSQAQMNLKIYDEMQWRCIGPHRAGRTVAISGVPGQQNVFYMAPNNGGVWKTIDYGQTWYPIFEGQPTQSIGALALAPSNPNIIYVASGEGLQRPDLSVGDGIYKSTDAGQTWTHLGLRDAQQMNSIIVDPKDPNRVFVAALGHPYGPNPERGVFRSLDGGKTFEKVLYKDENTGAEQVVFDPRNPQIVYADMWSARRPPWTVGNSYNGPGSGLFKSTDGGSTWQPLTNGLPGWNEQLGRIGFTVAPNDPNRMYAMVDAAAKPGTSGGGGLYASDDAGATWKKMNDEPRIWGRGSDFAEVKVDPRNSNVIWIANTSTYRSVDGGRRFDAVKGAPGGDDYHTIWINPENPNIIALAVDQGATISVNGGATWSSWYNQPTAQFYHVITDNRFPYWVYGGQQESGSVGIASRSDYGEITFREWHPVGVEEYGYVAPDPSDANIVFGGKGTKFNQTTGENQDVGPVVLRTGKYRYNRTAPIIFAHADPHTLYLGSNVLFKTTNGGQSWDIISPDLTRENPGVPPNLGQYAEFSDPAKGKHRGVIYAIGPSFKDVNTIWIGTDDGQIQVTRDGGKTWQNITPPQLTPWSKVAQIEASHFDEQTAYAAVNRLRLDDLHAYIYRTHDGGKTWQMTASGIPDNQPVNAVREDPVRKGLLYAATERGVWYSLDDGDHWQSLQFNLPATSVRDIVVHDQDLVVGTHGRSFWILDDISPLRQMNAQTEQAKARLYEPGVAYRVRRNQNTDTPLPPEVPAGQNPPEGAIIYYSLAQAPSTPVVIEISDAQGKLIRRFSSNDHPFVPDAKELNVPYYWIRMPRVPSISPGLHRVVWDLHYPEPQSLGHEYPISAIVRNTPRYPLGPNAVPGTYTVKLIVNGETQTQKLTVKMDPRVNLAQDGLQQLFSSEYKLAWAMDHNFAALNEVRSLRSQIKQLLPKAQGDAQQALNGLDKKLEATEGSAGGFGRPAATDTLAGVGGALGQVYNVVSSVDAVPTQQQQQTIGELLPRNDAILKRWTEMRSSEIGPVNAKLTAAGLPMLDPSKPAPAVGDEDEGANSNEDEP
ncbi:MAG TPA: glycoside hydrolase [Terriglobales bacterium]